MECNNHLVGVTLTLMSTVRIYSIIIYIVNLSRSQKDDVVRVTKVPSIPHFACKVNPAAKAVHRHS